MDKDKIKKVAIVGAGGIGSHFCKNFMEYGTYRVQYPFTSWEVDLYDDDVVDTKNLLHQNFKPEHLGLQKAQVLADEYLVTPQNRFMTKEDFPNYDLLFCCVDSMEFRKELYEYGKKHKHLYWIDGRCDSRRGMVFNYTMKPEDLDRYLTDNKERAGCLSQKEKESNVSHTTPIIVAATMLEVFLLLYRGDEKKIGEVTFLV